MKKMIKLLILSAAVALVAVPAVSAQDACSTEAKDALYAEFITLRKTDQAKANEVAKKYLACPAGQVTEAQQKIIDYLKGFVEKYEKAAKRLQLPRLMYNDKKYPEAYALGKEIVTANPDDTMAYIDLGANGYLVAQLKNPALNAEALAYARRAIELLEGGKTVENWAPFAGKDEALAYLQYTVGSLTLEKEPEVALKALLKSVQFETPLKKTASTYAMIAGAYETGAYAKMSDAYKAAYSGKDETPESKLALANINQIIDRMIDGYARAVALAGSDARFAANKTAWNEALVQWYKYRNQSETGLPEFIAGILAKPLPPEPTPLTSLPTPAPTATPVGTTGAAPTTGTAAGVAPKPVNRP